MDRFSPHAGHWRTSYDFGAGDIKIGLNFFWDPGPTNIYSVHQIEAFSKPVHREFLGLSSRNTKINVTLKFDYRFDGKSDSDGADGEVIFGAMAAGAVLTLVVLGVVAASCLVVSAKRKRERRNDGQRNMNSKGDVVASNSSVVVVKDFNSQVE